ncbi:MAG: hypothetical protein MJE68_08750 [Proteobacteria bacterium]|nr:hypothetical protein [Pseudomonadota bacterium]
MLVRHLLPYSSKWQSLGGALSLDEDRLDEIFTNNDRDEDCLKEVLELYMMRSDLKHSWEKIHKALQEIEKTIESSGEASPPPVIPRVKYAAGGEKTKHGAQEIEGPAEDQLIFVMTGPKSSLIVERAMPGSILEVDKVAAVDQRGKEDQHAVQTIEIVTTDECKAQDGQNLQSSLSLCLERPLEGTKG